MSSEIIAVINEHAFDALKLPVARVTTFDIPVPLLKSEDLYLPSKKRILQAIELVTA